MCQDVLVSGVVGWFDLAKGYGFVQADDGEGDIQLHVNVLRAFGVRTVVQGWRILVRVEITPQGRRAAEVRGLWPPDKKQEPPPDAGPVQAARVRWFNRDRGYGFVNVFHSRDDVFLHMATLQESGHGAVTEGIALAVRVTTGPRGPTVIEVRDWADDEDDEDEP